MTAERMIAEQIGLLESGRQAAGIHAVCPVDGSEHWSRGTTYQFLSDALRKENRDVEHY